MALQLFNPERAEYKLRSGLSLIEVYLLFVNNTQRDVNLYWIDYRGQKSLYLTLRPGLSSKVDTYQTHPWVFCDKYSGERMQVEHSYLYWPKRYLSRNPRNPSQLITCRRQITIHLPVRSLRDSCLWHIAKKIYRIPNIIDSFSIPQTLKNDLKIVLGIMENHLFSS